MLARRRPPLLTLRIALWRARHLVVCGVVIAAAWAGVRQLAPPPTPTGPVVVAARDVAAGASLVAADLRVARVPVHLVPDDAITEPTTLLGRSVVVGLPRGLAVVEHVLAGSRFALEPPDGTVVVPVSVSTTTSALLQAGDRVDLIAPMLPGGYGEVMPGPDGVPAEPEVLARGALVVDVGGGRESEGGGLVGLGADGGADPVTLVAVSADEGRRLAAAAASGPLGAVLVG
ncbi:MAG: hypothetical protein JWP95_1775 [Actinotalea sp.]|nr:hypothetical protein [Actinotalea sp.]